MLDKTGDVGLVEDMIFALLHIHATEKHSLDSYYLTKDKKWLELNDIARKMRQKYMPILVKKENSEIFCVTKHLLGGIIGLQECANRLYSQKKFTEAEEMYSDAGILLGLLLTLNNLK